MVHAWAKDYVKYDGQNVEPIQILPSGSGGIGKCHLVKEVYKYKSKTLHYHCKEPEKPRVLLLGPKGISALNIGGITFNSRLGIKPGTKSHGLNDKSEAALRNRLSELKLLLMDEIY